MARARSRMVWIADVLPNQIGPYIDGQTELGARLRCRARSSGARPKPAAVIPGRAASREPGLPITFIPLDFRVSRRALRGPVGDAPE